MVDERFVVEAADDGERLDRVLARCIKHLSRTQGARLISEGCVQVGGRGATASRRVHEGDVVTAQVPAPRPARVAPEALVLSVLFEDEHLLVLDKPAGLVVHPGAGVASGTLVNALVHHCGDSLTGVGGEMRPGIVHRLDKGTSGVMVVAKTDVVHQALSQQFASRTIGKAYLAVVRGAVDARGEIDAPIGRSRTNRTRMAVGGAAGRVARTSWTRSEAFGRSAALVEVLMLTGRTHQIRVHLAHAGHPLVGDETYGTGGARAPDPRARPVIAAFPRPALHAFRLALTHPVTGERQLHEAPVPDDFARLLDDLRIATSA